MDPSARQTPTCGHGDGGVASGVILAMLGLIPIAMHSTGAGYEPQGLIVIAIGIAVALHGSATQRRSEQQADRNRAYAQFPMVRSSLFDVQRPTDVSAPRARLRVPSIRVDIPELDAPSARIEA